MQYFKFKLLFITLFTRLLVISILFTGLKSQAKDLGLYGKIWNIKEDNTIDYIRSQITKQKAIQIANQNS